MFFPTLSSAFAATKGSTPQRYAVSGLPAPAVHVRVSRRPVVKRCGFPSGRAPPVDPTSLLRRPFRDGARPNCFEGARFGGSELRCGSGLYGVRRWSGAGQTKGPAGLFMGNLFQLTHYSFDAARD